MRGGSAGGRRLRRLHAGAAPSCRRPSSQKLQAQPGLGRVRQQTWNRLIPACSSRAPNDSLHQSAPMDWRPGGLRTRAWAPQRAKGKERAVSGRGKRKGCRRGGLPTQGGRDQSESSQRERETKTGTREQQRATSAAAMHDKKHSRRSLRAVASNKPDSVEHSQQVRLFFGLTATHLISLFLCPHARLLPPPPPTAPRLPPAAGCAAALSPSALFALPAGRKAACPAPCPGAAATKKRWPCVSGDKPGRRA